MYAQTDLSAICNVSGSYILDISDSSTQSNYSASATFTDCVVSEYGTTTTINGVLTISGSQSQITLTANITATENSVTETFSFAGTCEFNGTTIGACTYSSTFTGIDGRTYSIANVSVSGNPSAGYSVSGTVTDPDHGSITIATNQPVTFNCTNGNPDSGQITITGDGSATVTFNSCTSFTVTFNGNGTSHNWADI
ncbi:MAG: hypothetical protein OQL06_01000 [Gammaproteobacteria bacterium]|nr:hypothetical protein [Gammaproteobacteria bacterium]